MTVPLTVGDWIEVGVWSKKLYLVNKVLDDGSVMADKYVWYGDDYIIKHCKRLSKFTKVASAGRP